MTEEQAAEVVLLIRASTASRVEQSTLDYFSAALLALDYTPALSAATVGTITWRRFPAWADFKEMYRAQQRLGEPVGDQRQVSEEAQQDFSKRGVAAPEWVHVWYWSRVVREPPEGKVFPQQERFGDPKNLMSKDEYEKVRSEWKAAGSPKYEKPIPMVR